MAEYAMTWGETPTQDDKIWAAVAHLSCFTGFPILAPLLVMLVFGEKSKYVKYHAVQAIVGQVAVVILGVIATFGIMLISVVTCGIGSLLYIGLPLLGIVPLWGAYLAWDGKWQGFPALADVGKS